MEGMKQGCDRLDLCCRTISPVVTRGSNVDVERAGGKLLEWNEEELYHSSIFPSYTVTLTAPQVLPLRAHPKSPAADIYYKT